LSNIHPTAIVDKNARLGENVTIGPFSIIGSEVTIGDNAEISSHVRIDGWTKIGKNCKIFQGAVLGTIAQDLKFRGERTGLEIGDNTVIREYATLNLATGEGEKTIIGNNCFLMAYVHVAHNCVIGNEVILANAVNLAGHIYIEDYAILGGLTAVHQFVHIGQHCFVGGMTRVSQDILPYIRVAGSPLEVSGLNSVGLRRRGYSRESLSMLKKAYKLLFRSDLNTSQALEKIKSELPESAEKSVVVEFIEKSIERVKDPRLHGQGLSK
jgi:UDP-N-acetylglucosamine acyltransferase